MRHCSAGSIMAFLAIAFLAGERSFGDETTTAQIRVFVRAEAPADPVKPGAPIPLKIVVTNQLSASIDYISYGLKPTDWNGETAGISLVDIHRNGKSGNLFLASPKIKAPVVIAGLSRHEIAAGKQLTIETDATKWKLRDGWLPGRYRVTLRVNGLKVDNGRCTLFVLSEPFEFEIK